MAMNRLPAIEKNYEVYNLGTGCGYSVLEVVQGFEKAMGRPLNYSIGEPRHGDVAKLVANIKKGTEELGWKVTKSLDDMCKDSVTFIERRDQFNKEKAK
jgi:UDP-glucose 4-epimerase